VFTATVPVNNGNGSYDTIGAVPPTQGYPATAGNTYEWTATYSGDDNNSTVTTQCGSDLVSVP